MKKIIAFLPLMAILSVILIIAEKNDFIQNNDQLLLDKSKELNERFGTSYFYCVFSMEELRPFSIIQSESTLQLYLRNDEISPKMLAEELSESDKKYLVSQIADYAASLDSPEEANNLLKKMEYWCIGDKLFTVMNGEMGFFVDNLKNAIKRIDATKKIIQQYSQSNNIGKGDSKMLNDDPVYFEVLNYLSKQPFVNQLEYYSNIYHELSDICRDN
jgi:hypothetical protein